MKTLDADVHTNPNDYPFEVSAGMWFFQCENLTDFKIQEFIHNPSGASLFYEFPKL